MDNTDEKEDLTDALRWVLEVGVPHISDTAATRLVYVMLVWHAYSRGWDFVRISLSDLEQKTGLVKNTIRAATKRLEALGLIVRLGYATKTAETYRVLLPSDVPGPWGTARPATALASLPVVGRVHDDPLSRLTDEGRRTLGVVKGNLSPIAKAKIRTRAVALAKERSGGEPCSIEDVDRIEDEIILLESFGPDRLREFGVVR